MLSYKQAFHALRQQLQPLYDAAEAAAIAKEVLAHLTGKSYTQSLATPDAPLSAVAEEGLRTLSAALQQGKPLQYVLGYAWFMSRKFIVNEQVLIPRPETEELVQWIVDDNRQRILPFAVLDIGTGSGCIPVSLKLMLEEAAVISCDISAGALAVARTNAAALGATVDFKELDFLTQSAALPAYDIIVSNPPYIPLAEQDKLHPNVRLYEPGTALFVPDNDPLLFYKAIAVFGKTHLNAGGAVYCELHKDYAAATQDMFRGHEYHTELREDMNGHPRMLKAWQG